MDLTVVEVEAVSAKHKPAYGCLFIGSLLCDWTEFVNIEFGAVKFKARVLSRHEFSVHSTLADSLELKQKLSVGTIAPLAVAQEYLGPAQLETVTLRIVDLENGNDECHLDVDFIYQEVMPP